MQLRRELAHGWTTVPDGKTPPERPPGGETGSIVEETIELLGADRWEEASELLTREFAERSACARADPDYEVEASFGDGRHYAVCHLASADPIV